MIDPHIVTDQNLTENLKFKNALGHGKMIDHPNIANQ